MKPSVQIELLFAKFGVDPHELVWSGRPYQGLVLRTGDWFVVPVGLVVVVCVLIPVSDMLQSRGPNAWLAQLLAILLLALVLSVLFGRLFWDAYKRSITFYGLTSDSALILRHGLGAGIQRVFLPSVQTLNFNGPARGNGTILFGSSMPWYARMDLSTEPSVPAFEGIPDAWHVYDLCLRAQKSDRMPPYGLSDAARLRGAR